MKHLNLVLIAIAFVPAINSQTVAPVLQCVDYSANQDDPQNRGPFITSHWGYVNTGPTDVTIPPGNGNSFVPFPSYQGQPVAFHPGYHFDVFTTTLYFNDSTTNPTHSMTQGWTLGRIIVTSSNDPTKYCQGSDVACWDTNANGVCDPSEDVNGDGKCDARDCQGRIGAMGSTGPQGPQGPTGPAGPQGPAGISAAIRTVTTTSTTQTATATCNANEVLLNGGGTCAVPNTNIISGKAASSVPSGSNGWTISCSTGQASAVALCSTKQQ